MSYLPDGVPAPVPDPDDAAFWRNCNEGRLTFKACSACGHVQHPPQHFCPKCMGVDHRWVDAPRYGTVFTYTVTHHPGHPSVKGRTPYNVIVVDYPELGHVRFISNLVDATAVEIGAKVEVVWEQQGDQRIPRYRRADPAA